MDWLPAPGKLQRCLGNLGWPGTGIAANPSRQLHSWQRNHGRLLLAASEPDPPQIQQQPGQRQQQQQQSQHLSLQKS